MPRMTALGDYFREQAAAHRASGREHEDDPRYERSAEALDSLAGYADRAADEGLFQMRYLLDHHVADGTFAWPEGQSGRTIARYGFDEPVQGGEMGHEMFLMDLCDLARIDATRHIGTPENGFDRADAKEIADRYGLSVDRVHAAFDTGRGYVQLHAVGIPHWHELSDEARTELEAMRAGLPRGGRAAAAGLQHPGRGRERGAGDRRADRRHRPRRARRQPHGAHPAVS
jgi:hypothetical protein